MGEIFRLERAGQPLEFTGERLTTAACGQIEVEHLHRYCIAREACRGKDVLDIASGEGYGAALLAQVARRVIGVELDSKSVAHAHCSYARRNLSFVQGDARCFPLADASFDVIVSFETFEHFAEHGNFLREVTRVLKPGGVLLISTPDRDVYSPSGCPANPYHVRELTRDEFRSTLTNIFPEVLIYAQRAFSGSVIAPTTRTAANELPRTFERRDTSHIESVEGLARAPYLVAFASERPLADVIPISLYVARSEVDADRDSSYDVRTSKPDERNTASVQVYPFINGRYSEDTSVHGRIHDGTWESITLDLPDGSQGGPIRIDPADCPCVIQIGRLAVRSPYSGDALWRADSPAALRAVQASGSSIVLSDESACRLVSYGTDPQIQLPVIETPLKPLRIELFLHINKAPEAIYRALEAHASAVNTETQRYRAELNSSYVERMLVAAELKRVATDRNQTHAELIRATEALQSAELTKSEQERQRHRLESEAAALRSQLQISLNAQRSELDALQTKLFSLEQSLAAERQIRTGLEGSISWRTTRPARALMRLLRSLLRR